MLPNQRTVLLKVSGPNYSAVRGTAGNWLFVSGNATSGHSESFAAAQQVIINHNLGRRPSNVTVRNHGGVQLVVETVHLNVNQMILNFDVPTSGTVEIS